MWMYECIKWGTPVYLNGSAACRDKRLHSSGVISSCKLLLLRLPPLNHGDRHQLFVHSGVQIQDLKHLQIHYTKNVFSDLYNTGWGWTLVLLLWIDNEWMLDISLAVTSSAASSLVAKAVCPSCHRNSLVLRKGWGCLNSHLWREEREGERGEEKRVPVSRSKDYWWSKKQELWMKMM